MIEGRQVNQKVVQVQKVKGPQASKYVPEFDKGAKKFKDGTREDSSDSICKKRHTLLYVTALANVNMTIVEDETINRML